MNTTIHFFEIGADPLYGDAHYKQTATAEVAAADAQTELEDHIGKGTWRGNATSHSRPPGRRFERLLDIKAVEGDHLYAVHLDAVHDGRQRLAFATPSGTRPIMQIPLGVPGLDGVMRDVCHIEDTDGTPRWASFRLDTDEVRRIAQELFEGRKDAPPGRIRVPFYFNVIDPELGVPPWIFEEHPRPGGGERSAKAADNLVTHGGVHPPMQSYLVVAL